MSAPIDAADRAIVAATQGGLPLCTQPYHAIADQVGLAAEEVMGRLRRMQERGIVRRIGAVPNHYRLGYRANGMSVWDLPDDRVSQLGRQVGALDFVSHCYRRPRRLPAWPYNLFAMVHGRSRAEVEDQVARIKALLGDAVRAHDVLYSTRILKKTGLRLVSKCSD
jgi:DNA-binding Lrp family transcriptional regulator